MLGLDAAGGDSDEADGAQVEKHLQLCRRRVMASQRMQHPAAQEPHSRGQGRRLTRESVGRPFRDGRGLRRPAGGVSRLRTGARLARRSLPRIAGLLQHLLAEDYPSILMKKVGYDGLHFSAWDGTRWESIRQIVGAKERHGIEVSGIYIVLDLRHGTDDLRNAGILRMLETLEEYDTVNLSIQGAGPGIQPPMPPSTGTLSSLPWGPRAACIWWVQCSSRFRSRPSR